MTVENEPRDYHGRWTAGSAAAESRDLHNVSVSDRGPYVAVENMAHAEDAKRIALAASLVAMKLGFDPTKINVTDTEAKFVLNGREWNAAGEADRATGLITLYTQQLSPSSIPGVTAHEIMHQKFNAFTQDYDAERKKMTQDPAYLSNGFMKADGFLAEPYASKYPLYQQYQKLMEPSITEGFAKSDGVSQYSRDWWTSWKAGQAKTDQAFHETLAEMAKIHYEKEYLGAYPKDTPGVPGAPEWQALYKAVSDHWDKRSKA